MKQKMIVMLTLLTILVMVLSACAKCHPGARPPSQPKPAAAEATKPAAEKPSLPPAPAFDSAGTPDDEGYSKAGRQAAQQADEDRGPGSGEQPVLDPGQGRHHEGGRRAGSLQRDCGLDRPRRPAHRGSVRRRPSKQPLPRNTTPSPPSLAMRAWRHSSTRQSLPASRSRPSTAKPPPEQAPVLRRR